MNAKGSAFRTTKTRRRRERQRGGFSGTKQEHMISLGASSVITFLDFLFGFGGLNREKEKEQPNNVMKPNNQTTLEQREKSLKNSEEEQQKAIEEEQQKAIEEEQQKTIEEEQRVKQRQNGRVNYIQKSNV